MFRKPLNNESGFILVLALAMLVVLSIIGLSGTRTSVIDLKIAGNEREMTQEFYVSDSVWQIGALWLNHLASAPDIVNITLRPGDDATDFETDDYYKIVRNYGAGGDGTTNQTFPATTEDGSLGGYDFWYRLIMDDGKPAVGFSAEYEDFPTEVDANTEARTQISTRIFKVLKVGYH